MARRPDPLGGWPPRRASSGPCEPALIARPPAGPDWLHEVTLAIVCEPCGRRGRYNVERLMAEHGDAELTNILGVLADCPKARSVSVHDRCKAVYDGL
jgi:hypothetical protein